MSEPVEKSDINNPATKLQGEELARYERKVASRLDMSPYSIPLLGGALAFLVGLFLPFTGTVKGLDVMFYTPAAEAAHITIPERIFVWIGLIGAVILNLAAYFLKNTLLAHFAWLLGGIAMFFSIMAIWMRQTSMTGGAPNIGLVTCAVGSVAVVYGLYDVVMHKSKEQVEVEEARRQETPTDPLALAQLESLKREKEGIENPALVDDRRSRAQSRRSRSKAVEQTSDEATEGSSTEEPSTEESSTEDPSAK